MLQNLNLSIRRSRLTSNCNGKVVPKIATHKVKNLSINPKYLKWFLLHLLYDLVISDLGIKAT